MRFLRFFAVLPLLLTACSSGYQAHFSAQEDVLRIELSGAAFTEDGGIWLEAGSEREALPSQAPANGFGGITHFDYELESERVLKVRSHKSGPTDRMWRGPWGECVMQEAQQEYNFEHPSQLGAVLLDSAQRC